MRKSSSIADKILSVFCSVILLASVSASGALYSVGLESNKESSTNGFQNAFGMPGKNPYGANADINCDTKAKNGKDSFTDDEVDRAFGNVDKKKYPELGQDKTKKLETKRKNPQGQDINSTAFSPFSKKLLDNQEKAKGMGMKNKFKESFQVNCHKILALENKTNAKGVKIFNITTFTSVKITPQEDTEGVAQGEWGDVLVKNPHTITAPDAGLNLTSFKTGEVFSSSDTSTYKVGNYIYANTTSKLPGEMVDESLLRLFANYDYALTNKTVDADDTDLVEKWPLGMMPPTIKYYDGNSDGYFSANETVYDDVDNSGNISPNDIRLANSMFVGDGNFKDGYQVEYPPGDPTDPVRMSFDGFITNCEENNIYNYTTNLCDYSGSYGKYLKDKHDEKGAKLEFKQKGPDLNNKLSVFADKEQYLDKNANGQYDIGEYIYANVEDSRGVNQTDVPIFSNYDESPESQIDMGPLVQFNGTTFYHDRDGSGNFTQEDTVYLHTGMKSRVNEFDTRLANAKYVHPNFEDGSIVHKNSMIMEMDGKGNMMKETKLGMESRQFNFTETITLEIPPNVTNVDDISTLFVAAVNTYSEPATFDSLNGEFGVSNIENDLQFHEKLIIIGETNVIKHTFRIGPVVETCLILCVTWFALTATVTPYVIYGLRFPYRIDVYQPSEAFAEEEVTIETYIQPLDGTVATYRDVCMDTSNNIPGFYKGIGDTGKVDCDDFASVHVLSIIPVLGERVVDIFTPLKDFIEYSTCEEAGLGLDDDFFTTLNNDIDSFYEPIPASLKSPSNYTPEDCIVPNPVKFVESFNENSHVVTEEMGMAGESFGKTFLALLLAFFPPPSDAGQIEERLTEGGPTDNLLRSLVPGYDEWLGDPLGDLEGQEIVLKAGAKVTINLIIFEKDIVDTGFDYSLDVLQLIEGAILYDELFLADGIWEGNYADQELAKGFPPGKQVKEFKPFGDLCDPNIEKEIHGPGIYRAIELLWYYDAGFQMPKCVPGQKLDTTAKIPFSVIALLASYEKLQQRGVLFSTFTSPYGFEEVKDYKDFRAGIIPNPFGDNPLKIGEKRGVPYFGSKAEVPLLGDEGYNLLYLRGNCYDATVNGQVINIPGIPPFPLCTNISAPGVVQGVLAMDAEFNSDTITAKFAVDSDGKLIHTEKNIEQEGCERPPAESDLFAAGKAFGIGYNLTVANQTDPHIDYCVYSDDNQTNGVISSFVTKRFVVDNYNNVPGENEDYVITSIDELTQEFTFAYKFDVILSFLTPTTSLIPERFENIAFNLVTINTDAGSLDQHPGVSGFEGKTFVKNYALEVTDQDGDNPINSPAGTKPRSEAAFLEKFNLASNATVNYENIGNSLDKHIDCTITFDKMTEDAIDAGINWITVPNATKLYSCSGNELQPGKSSEQEISINPPKHFTTTPSYRVGYYQVEVGASSANATKRDMAPIDPSGLVRINATNIIQVNVTAFGNPILNFTDPETYGDPTKGEIVYNVTVGNFGNDNDILNYTQSFEDSNKIGCDLFESGDSEDCPFRAQFTTLQPSWTNSTETMCNEYWNQTGACMNPPMPTQENNVELQVLDTCKGDKGTYELKDDKTNYNDCYSLQSRLQYGLVPAGERNQAFHITIPGNWAGIDDTTYKLIGNLTAQSDIEEGKDGKFITHTVNATTESSIRYVGLEIMKLIEDVDGAPADQLAKGPQKGLLSYLEMAIDETNNKALEIVCTDSSRNGPDGNLETAQKQLDGFIYAIQGLEPKQINGTYAEKLIFNANSTIQDIDAAIANDYDPARTCEESFGKGNKFRLAEFNTFSQSMIVDISESVDVDADSENGLDVSLSEEQTLENTLETTDSNNDKDTDTTPVTEQSQPDVKEDTTPVTEQSQPDVKKDTSSIITKELDPDTKPSKSDSSSIIEKPTAESQNKVPEWIKNNAAWWADEKISEKEFVQGIQYLINEKVISVDAQSKNPSSSEKVPDWIKNNASWWSQDLISEGEFLNGITYLVDKGIIQITS